MRINRLAGKVLLILALVTLALSSSICAWGQASPSPASASTGPKLQAELLKTIDASHARVGDEVTARTITPLEFNRSKFPPGAVVKGHVAQASPDRMLLMLDSIMTM